MESAPTTKKGTFAVGIDSYLEQFFTEMNQPWGSQSLEIQSAPPTKKANLMSV
jgi:hypothetical protein